jgi:ubiquinone/menaquinone biosynthesis C-methylase UbiE
VKLCRGSLAVWACAPSQLILDCDGRSVVFDKEHAEGKMSEGVLDEGRSSGFDLLAAVAALGNATGSRVDRVRYRLRQQGLAIGLGIPGRVWSMLLSPSIPRPSAASITALERRFQNLLDRDIENAERGSYPRSLLHQFPTFDYLRVLPEALLDVPRFVWRSLRRQHDDLPAGVELGSYPQYYRRTFHWQTDGWLSARSARLYDASVEFLFGGTADVMRRMAIPPLVESLRDRDRPQVLDIACGTGRFLLQLGRALPKAKLYGLDLSPFYLRQAARVLESEPEVSLIADDAERMPLADAVFDAVTSVFLFHELPSDVRRNVAREVRRVLKPGGRFVVCDSAQLPESGEISDFLYAFPATYHEPYYKGYLRDDLAEVLRECEFEVESSEPHFVSKVVVARKPNGSTRARRARRRTAR